MSLENKILELKSTLVNNGFKNISTVNNNFQMFYKKKELVVIIDYEIVENEYWLYIQRNGKYIYRKHVYNSDDVEPMMRLAMN